uniref:Protocadherin 2 alpha a 15 n=1 Tax=Neolamprologus brichardi TaxID=32507 RepID=A0A3Q4GJU7_NEOBR
LALSRSPLIGVFVVLLFFTIASGQLRYSISEELTEGSVVGNIAKDLGIDLNIMKQRGFRIISGSTEPLFNVNEDDGVLYAKRKIDREEVCKDNNVCVISLKTVLENPLEIHYVIVEIADLNDHSPAFPDKAQKLEIFESALPGAQYQLQNAHDPDSGTNSIQQYKISQNDHFRLEIKDRGKDGKTPTLTLGKQLDREVKSSHKLVLMAIDGGTPQNTGTVEICIDVLDVNDNMPVFIQDTYSAVLQENTPAGTTVIQVNATDLDDGPNGEVVYSFGSGVKGKIRELFDIDSVTGEIIVKGHIDFEEQDSYHIDIQASDKGSIPFKTYKSVIINIGDINDNPPEIEVASLSSAVSEDSRPGTTVALLSITDSDSGLNGKIIMCDRNKMCVIDLKTVLENPLEVHYVAVEILDVNDHAPIFPEKENTLEISESALPGARFQLQAARDADSGSLSVQQYKLSHNEHFRLEVKDRGEDRKTPSLVLQKSLDRESVKTHVLLLTAFDGGKPPRSGNMTIIVNVSDVNDNPPVFSKEAYSAHLKENSPFGTTVIQVNATDLDEGLNGEVVYSFGNDVEARVRERFDLNPVTGEIIVAGLIDFEESGRYEIDIQASDKGAATMTTDKVVIINIIDVNDNAPEIEVTSFSHALPENSKPGTTVALISYRSGEKRYMLVGPRMSIGSTIVPGSHANTLVLPDRRRTSEVRHTLKYDVLPLSCTFIFNH